MKPWLKWTVGVLIVSGYSACSPKQFSSESSCQHNPGGCVSQNNRDYYNYVETVDFGKVDVLVVTDSSASMSFEQDKMANRFNGFIQNLDTKNVNYRIGVMTTDVSASANNGPRPINRNGALLDGKLIELPGFGKYLTNSSGTLAQKDTAFKAAVKIQETLACEQFIANWPGSRDTQAYADAYRDACPSGDERGIYALSLAIDSGAEGMIRSEADLAIIILSDEDVRSGLYCSQWSGAVPNATCVQEGQGSNFFPREARDRQENLRAQIQAKYPNKRFSAHAIVVKDANCLNTQNAQMGGLVSGSYGQEYMHLANNTVDGTVGSICGNYANQLKDIFDNVTQKMVSKIALACANPPDLTVANVPALGMDGVTPVTWAVVGSEIQFNTNLPVGSSVNVTYSCPSY